MKFLAYLVELYLAGVLLRLLWMILVDKTPKRYGLQRPYRMDEFMTYPLMWPMTLAQWLIGLF